jgi:hypothetical protein
LGDAELLSSCRKTLEGLRTEAASKETLRKFGAIERWAVESRDEVMLDVCRQWAANRTGSVRGIG